MKKITKIVCNKCGKEIKIVDGILKEDVFEAAKEWGYFSKKDLQLHKFNICEACYDKMILEFVVPIEVLDKREAL